MIKLQNNFTTVEQSKRLLELGVPRWTADMYYQFDSFQQLYRMQAFEDGYEHSSQMCEKDLPCWSVGRLMEIYEICSGKVWDNTVIEGYSKIDMLLEDFDNYECRLNFSKLEE